ncbi:helix-turn-helix domain-containing protein [Amycolatopsis taiwanensis]|uniref:helix-turn-helix domain-containing protein n=1 Tax=Amycolatopsis taiwanensis TaxID=342230 RepID=UPI0004AD55AE|nr:helix-turn-helix transcriptional regulator [Amycolatopsis taiwanensis]
MRNEYDFVDDGGATGRRIREIRLWRKLSLRQTAELSGISFGYLSKIERGERSLESRKTREAIARTLRVSPADLGGPYPPVDSTSNRAHQALDPIEAVLTAWLPGEVPDERPARPWGDVKEELRKLIDELRPTSDYAAMGELVPDLILDLLIYGGDPQYGQYREEAFRGLIGTYHATGRVTAAMGSAHLSYLMSDRVMQTAKLLDDPEWLGIATWTRAHYISSRSRSRQYQVAVEAAEMAGARLESRGMGHLTAALAKAAQGDADGARMHLAEADDMATKIGELSLWGEGTMNFGRSNVGIWRVGLNVELGRGPGVAEIAKDVAWQAAPRSRQGAYWMDLGRGLIQDKKTRAQGLAALLQAEELTPQQVRNNQFVRDAVTSMMTVARRDAGGRELRGLAWRMGVAPIG